MSKIVHITKVNGITTIFKDCMIGSLSTNQPQLTAQGMVGIGSYSQESKMKLQNKNLTHYTYHEQLMSLVCTLYIIGNPHECVNSYLYQIEIVCGASYHTRAQLKCDMRPCKQRDLIQLAVTHMSVVLLLSFIAYKQL